MSGGTIAALIMGALVVFGLIVGVFKWNAMHATPPQADYLEAVARNPEYAYAQPLGLPPKQQFAGAAATLSASRRRLSASAGPKTRLGAHGRNTAAATTTTMLARDADGYVVDGHLQPAGAAGAGAGAATAEYATYAGNSDTAHYADPTSNTGTGARTGVTGPRKQGSVYLGFENDNEESML